jgi:hypothetical protein
VVYVSPKDYFFGSESTNILYALSMIESDLTLTLPGGGLSVALSPSCSQRIGRLTLLFVNRFLTCELVNNQSFLKETMSMNQY